VSNAPPPLLGFNNNVRHRGRIFHIQTEDSGVKSPRIVTHLFADGGRIIKTTRTEYAEHITRPDMQPFVRSLMKEQHKGMFTALRLGELDKLLEDVCGPFDQPLQSKAPPPPVIVSAPPPAPLAEPLVTERPRASDFETPPLASAFGDDDRVSERPERANTLSNPNLRKVAPSVPPPSAAPLDVDVASLDRLPAKPPPPPERAERAQATSPPSLLDGAPLPRRQRPASGSTLAAAAAPPNLSRPTSRFASAPSKSASSIFGDGVISEQSLDEVILSYLAEDLDGTSE
jgi:hypothetical protein